MMPKLHIHLPGANNTLCGRDRWWGPKDPSCPIWGRTPLSHLPDWFKNHTYPEALKGRCCRACQRILEKSSSS